MLVLLLSFTSQILLIMSLCPDAYMCPVPGFFVFSSFSFQCLFCSCPSLLISSSFCLSAPTPFLIFFLYLFMCSVPVAWPHSVCVYDVCIYIDMYVCHTYVCMQVCVCVCVCLCLCLCVCVCVCECLYLYMLMYIYVYIFIYMHVLCIYYVYVYE